MTATAPLAAIFGCSGTRLTGEERAFFRDADPLGFILFARNCETPEQVRTLVDDLRASIGRTDAPVLIDQEGGRVARLKPPYWYAAPPAATFGRLALSNPRRGVEAARLNARLIAADLHALGITVDCAPVLDIPQPGAHDIIGDRAAGPSADIAILIGRAIAEGLLDGGVLPVIKHIPGHGRALADSHEALPVVDAEPEELAAEDFSPFRALNDMPYAMTAHVVYSAFDDKNPATTSHAVVEGVIRDHIGFDGLLLTDDLSMKALSGSPEERTKRALHAGCDVMLHCNGDSAEMIAIAGACASLTDAAQAHLARAEAMRLPPDDLDRDAARVRLEQLLKRKRRA